MGGLLGPSKSVYKDRFSIKFSHYYPFADRKLIINHRSFVSPNDGRAEPKCGSSGSYDGTEGRWGGLLGPSKSVYKDRFSIKFSHYYPFADRKLIINHRSFVSPNDGRAEPKCGSSGSDRKST